MASRDRASARPVEIPLDGAPLQADLALPDGSRALVVFAHGAGSSRHSPRNLQVARRLQDEGLGTLLLDLLTRAEEGIDVRTAELRFDVELLAGRLTRTMEWLDAQADLGEDLSVGFFGASTGAAAALLSAARQQGRISAVVSRGGRPDLAGDALPSVRAPTLLIVGSHDVEVLELNRKAAARLLCEHRLVVVGGATHLFEEPGALEQVSDLAAGWFTEYLESSHR